MRVIAVNRDLSHELTAAFHYPGVLFAAEDFVKRNRRFAVNSIEPYRREDRYAIMIRQGLDKRAVWVLILGGTLCCIFIGILVGILTKSLNIGLTVTSGIATVAACVEGFIFWAYK